MTSTFVAGIAADVEKRVAFHERMRNASTDKVVESIVSGDYDLHAFIDTPVIGQEPFWEDIAISIVLKKQFGVTRNNIKRRLDILQALIDYSTVFNTPLALLRFLDRSMDPNAVGEEIYIYANSEPNSEPIFHVLVAATIKDSIWRSIVNIVLSGFLERGVDTLQPTSVSYTREEENKYTSAITSRHHHVAIVLLYAKHLLTIEQITTLTTELAALPYYILATEIRSIFTAADADQVRVAEVYLRALYKDIGKYTTAEDYELIAARFDAARKKLCEKEIFNTVIGVAGLDILVHSLQYIVYLAVPCCDKFFSPAQVTNLILSAQKVRRVKLGLASESDYEKRPRIE